MIAYHNYKGYRMDREADKRIKYEEEQRIYREKQRIEAIPFEVIHLSNHKDFTLLCKRLADGSMHATRCNVIINGAFSQTISKAYNSLYKVRALRRRGECGLVAGGLIAGEKLFKGELIAPMAFFIKEVGEDLYRDDQFAAALCLPSADYACLALVAGLHLASNDGLTVLLRVGGRDWHPPMPL